VDDQWYDRLSKFKWYSWNSRGKYYAVRKVNREMTFMHRIIAGTPVGMITDHINGNTLDNRCSNLRICDYSQNQHNRIRNSSSTSCFKGVSYNKIAGRFQVRIAIAGKQMHIGYFENEEDAARAYDQAAIKYHREYAVLNFPDEVV